MAFLSDPDPQRHHALLADPSMVSAADGSRAQIAWITFLQPEQLPSAAAVSHVLDKKRRMLCLQALSLEEQAVDAAIASLDERLPDDAPAARPDVATMMVKGEPATFDVHDDFFHIGRAAHDNPLAYLRSSFQASVVLRNALSEAPTTLAAASIGHIVHGLRTSIASALGVTCTPEVPPLAQGVGPAAPDFPIRRWIRGHQLFAALTQGLIFAVEALHEATEQHDLAAAGAAADALAAILNACAATLVFTGDFPPLVYERLIRPSMCAPFLPAGFSGLLSADHNHLVRRMRMTRSTMQSLMADDPARHAGIAAALAAVYDCHKHVCARFVGADTASLLTEKGERSSVEQLEAFKKIRMRLLG